MTRRGRPGRCPIGPSPITCWTTRAPWSSGRTSIDAAKRAKAPARKAAGKTAGRAPGKAQKAQAGRATSVRRPVRAPVGDDLRIEGCRRSFSTTKRGWPRTDRLSGGLERSRAWGGVHRDELDCNPIDQERGWSSTRRQAKSVTHLRQRAQMLSFFDSHGPPALLGCPGLREDAPTPPEPTPGPTAQAKRKSHVCGGTPSQPGRPGPEAKRSAAAEVVFPRRRAWTRAFSRTYRTALRTSRRVRSTWAW